MLKEEEWITISDLLCDLYSEHDLNSLVKKIMTCLRILVPYSCGYCILTDEENEIRPDSSYFTGMDEAAQKLYLNKYYDKDYLKILYDITHETRVYRDTDILDDSVRKNTEIFRGFMKPHDIPYGCGIMLIKKHRLIGIINLFKSSSMGDFTEKDIFILDVLKKHLRNMFINSDAFENMTEAGRLKKMEIKYGFTPRESEIVKLALKGLSNEEICRKLIISDSTVKKHFYSIYGKVGVHSRVKLINALSC